MQTLLALTPLADDIPGIDENFTLIRLWQAADTQAVVDACRDAITGIISSASRPVPRALIDSLPNLQIIAQSSVGTDNIDLEAAKERGVAVTNTPDVLTDDTADIAMALMLSTLRRIAAGDRYVRHGRWKREGDQPLGTALAGKTVCIVGLGRIGGAIARRCTAFGLNVIYHNRRAKPDAPYAFEPDLEKAAARADILVVVLPGGNQTKQLIDASVLRALGPRGFLINIARGSVVDETALIAALRDGTIAGAGLDVFENEPAVNEAFFVMDNVVLLPHIGSATTESRRAMGQLVLDNLLAHFEGRPLLTPVF